MATRILVPGATGATGRLIVRDAVADGHAVVALVRPGRRAADLPGAEVEEGDARDEGALSRALAGCDGVVSALGSGASPFREVIVLCVATRAVVAAMARGGVRRLVCITGLGAGDSRGHGGLLYDRLVLPLLLRNVYRDKDRQEAAIRASALEWVIVRPVMLNDEPARGRVRAVADLAGVHGGRTARADVARFVVDPLTTDTWLRRAPLVSRQAGRGRAGWGGPVGGGPVGGGPAGGGPGSPRAVRPAGAAAASAAAWGDQRNVRVQNVVSL